MFADLFSHLTALATATPVTSAGGSAVAACGTIYLLTRMPEFLLLTATAALYAGVAMLSVQY